MADNLTPKEEFLLNPVTEHNITDAAVASFETNFKHPLKVTVPITPTQDLHGMPNPYPAGASVNLIPDGTDTENGYVAGQYLVTDGTTTANTNYYVSEYFQISENTTYTWSNRVNISVSPAICFYDENKTFISGININGQYSQTFTSPVGAVYCRSSQTTYTFQEASSVNAAFQLKTGETATAYRRYSNICPISGYTGCVINRSGINLADYSTFIENYRLNNSGGLSSNSTYATSQFISVKPGHTYKFINLITSSYGYALCEYDKNKNFIDYHNFGSGATPVSGTRAVSDSTYYIRVSCWKPSLKNSVYPGVNYPYTNNNYIASKGIRSLPIIFTNPSTGDPMTVYGGSLTLNEDGSADIVTTWASVKPGTTGFGFTAQGTYRKTFNGILYGGAYVYTSSGWHIGQIYNIGFCDKIKIGPTSNINGDYGNITLNGAASASSIDVWVRADLLANMSDKNATKNSINAWFAEHDIMLVIKLRAPLHTYHFSNVGQLKAFLGENNVWSDIANVNVKYLTQNSETGLEYRGDRALELRRRAMIADSPHIHTTVGSSETNGLASFKSYVKAPVKKIEIPFSPKQDFNGYDHPWPGGGYVQLFNSATTTYGSKIDTDGTLTEDANYFVSDFIPVTASTYYYVSGEMPVVVGYNSSKEFLQVIKNSGTDGAFQTPENCAYVRIQNYTEESDASAQASAAGTAYVCAGSEENQWYPYENICPIQGYDGVNIVQTRKNLFGGNALASAFHDSFNLTINDSELGPYVRWSGVVNGKLYCKDYFKVKENTCYTLIFGIQCDSAESWVLSVNYTDGSKDSISSVSANKFSQVVFISKENKTISFIDIQQRNVNKNVYFNYSGVFEGVITVDDFAPYVDTSIPLTFNQSGDHSFLPIQDGSGDPSPENIRSIHPGLTFTRDDDSVLSVYGGTLTVNADGTGSLASNMALVDLGDFTYTKNTISGTEHYYFTSNNNSAPNAAGCSNYITDGSVCTNYKGRGLLDQVDNAFSVYRTAARINVLDFAKDNYTVEEFKAAMSGIKLAYVLETPITYTLSVTETNRALEALGLTQHIGPIYGGTVTINPDGSADVVSDVVGMDLGTINWQNLYDDHRYNAGNVLPYLGDDYPLGWFWSDRFTIRVMGFSSNNPYTIGPSTGSYKRMIFAYDPDYANAIDFKAAMNGVYLYYKTPTPQTYHFSNLEQLKAWLGENNFWCDISDDITVKYLNRG